MKKLVFLFILLSSVLCNVFANPPYAYKIKADHFRRMGARYYSLAIKEYEQAIRQRENYAECYYWIAWIFKEKAMYEQALMEVNIAIRYKDALEYQSMFIDMLYLKAEILFKHSMTNEGIKILEEIVDYLKRYRREVTDISEAPVFRRKFGRAYFLLGSFYRRSSKLDNENVKYFLMAIRLEFQPALSHYFLYEYYKSKGNETNANSHLESAKRVLKKSGRTIEELKETISGLDVERLWKIKSK